VDAFVGRGKGGGVPFRRVQRTQEEAKMAVRQGMYTHA